ncbi:hypothetical protein [Streptomyces microflavus]|uniref:hypothetical protein n=1 Tax=Streptomyces microflavus TaxID=1919 RepID=UPI002E33F741|nr:hypothetical protein [Streptomyces microflavus]
MAFPETPLGLRGELMLGGSWVNITKDIYTREPIRIVHGTANEGAQPDPASCSLLLNNAGGKYSPRNSLGPHFGLLTRNTPVRITVPAAESWLRLDGGHASTPSTAALATPGDLDVRVEVSPDDWVVYGRVRPLIGRWDGGAGLLGWRLAVLTDGTLDLSWSSTGAVAGVRNASSTLAVGGPGDGRLCVRAVLDVNNGSAGCTATFYTAPTMAGPWTVLGAPVVSAGTTTVASPATSVVLGSSPGLGLPGIPLAGRVYRAEVRSGIGGTLLTAPDFTGLVDGATGVTDSAGRVWSLSGTATVSRRECLFTGEVSDWPPRWTGAGHDAWVPVQAAGILRRLGQGRRPLESTLRRRVPSAPGLLAYWPMEDAAGATQLYSPIPGVLPVRVSGMSLAADDSLPGSAPLPSLGAVASMSATVPHSPSAGWHVEMVYRLPAMPIVLTEILRVNIAGSVMRSAHVFASTSAIRIEARNADGGTIQFFDLTTTAAITDFAGIWNRLSLFVVPVGGTQTRLTAAWRDIATGDWWRANTTFTGTMGTATAVAGIWGGATQGMTLGHLGVFSVPGVQNGTGALPGVTIYNGADSGYDRETAVDRVRRLAAEEPILRLAARDGDNSTASELMGPQGRAELLSLLGELGETDSGILAETMDRVGLLYRDRATLYNQVPRLTLDYAAGEVAPPLEPAEDDADRPNDVTVTRAGGSSGRVVIEDGPNGARPPEEGGVGTYEEAVTLSLGTDAQARPIAGWRAHLGTWDEARYPTVRVELHRRPELIPQALRLHVGDLVRITNPPMYTGPGPLDLIVRQIQHEPRPRAWVLTLSCTPAGPYRVGVAGGPRDHVDTAGSRLSAATTATDTVLQVEVTAGRTWMEAPAPLNPNSTFGQGLGGWTGSGATITRVAAPHPAPTTDEWALRLAPDGGAQYPNAGSDQIAVTAGQSYTLSGWLRSATTRNVALNLNWFGPNSAYLSTTPTDQPVPPETWTYFSVTATAPVGAVTANLAPTVPNYPPAADVLWASHITLRPAGGSPVDFPFDIRVGGEVMTVQGVGPVAGTAQPFTVIRSTNGIVKPHQAGTDVRLAHPAIVAL